jgi:phosphate transport system substrate-binding protein
VPVSRFPRILIASFAVALFSLAARAQYVPREQANGTLRIWGSEQMQDLLRLWEAGFHRYQPKVRFDGRMKGTISAMGGLYAGAADLALMGREIWPEETLAYRQVTGSAPTGIQVALGSFDVPTKADALMIFVRRDNPLSEIRFDQLAALFGCGDHEPATWAEAGVTGELGKQPVHVYGYSSDNGAGKFFRHIVLHDAQWNCALHAFENRQAAGGARIDAGQQIIDALTRDPLGIAISNIRYATPAVKALAISEGPGSQFVAPVRQEYLAGRYPLTRAVYIFFDCAPAGSQCTAAVDEFLRYVLSRQGQEDVSREGGYGPLPDSIRLEQLAQLPGAK